MVKRISMIFVYSSFVVSYFYFLTILNIEDVWYYFSVPLVVSSLSRRRLSVLGAFFVSFFGILIARASDYELLKLSTLVEALVVSSGVFPLIIRSKLSRVLLSPLLPAIFSFLYFSPLSGIVNYVSTVFFLYIVEREVGRDG